MSREQRQPDAADESKLRIPLLLGQHDLVVGLPGRNHGKAICLLNDAHVQQARLAA